MIEWEKIHESVSAHDRSNHRSARIRKGEKREKSGRAEYMTTAALYNEETCKNKNGKMRKYEVKGMSDFCIAWKKDNPWILKALMCIFVSLDIHKRMFHKRKFVNVFTFVTVYACVCLCVRVRDGAPAGGGNLRQSTDALQQPLRNRPPLPVYALLPLTHE